MTAQGNPPLIRLGNMTNRTGRARRFNKTDLVFAQRIKINRPNRLADRPLLKKHTRYNHRQLEVNRLQYRARDQAHGHQTVAVTLGSNLISAGGMLLRPHHFQFSVSATGCTNFTFINTGQVLGNADSLGLRLGDVDGDGDLDALMANLVGLSLANRVFTNDGSGGLYGQRPDLVECRQRGRGYRGYRRRRRFRCPVRELRLPKPGLYQQRRRTLQ